MNRKPAVAGYFYPSGADELTSLISSMVDPAQEKKRALAVISPHAGFVYSGPVAGALYSSVQLPDRFVLIGPSHRMIDSKFAVMVGGTWITPLGEVPVDSELANLITSRTDLISVDEAAHAHEHSIEVQLPFIQYFNKNVSIVPITIGYHASFEELEELGSALAQSVQESGQDVLIVASTDMSHYVSHQKAKRLDFMAIQEIQNLSPRGLYNVVTVNNISMCGYQPTTGAMVAAVRLGAQKADLIKYQTSGEISGDFGEVVGYAGIRIM
jgi:AmmeMemoRadiSam system protein B